MNKISIINLRELPSLKNKEECVFVNFANNYAVKIGDFYQKIKKNERIKLISLFNQLTGINIREDTLGKLHIILLKLLIDGEKDIIVISSIGFHMISFQFLIDNFNKIFKNSNLFFNKNIIILDCNINNSEDHKYLEEYFAN